MTEPTLPPEAIRYRAYLLWEKEGRPDGRDTDFWFRAEKELLAETPADSAAPSGLEAAGVTSAEAQPALPPLKPKATLATARSAAGASSAPKARKPASTSRCSL